MIVNSFVVIVVRCSREVHVHVSILTLKCEMWTSVSRTKHLALNTISVTLSQQTGIIGLALNVLVCGTISTAFKNLSWPEGETVRTN